MKKVFIVDDSAFMRKIISDIVNQDSELTVIDTARNGKEALEKLKYIHVDILTLDIEMPIMNGIETLKELKKNNIDIPVLMLSSLTRDGAELTLKALEIGAIDFITKPSSIFKVNNDEKKNEIISKIKGAINTKTIFITNTEKIVFKEKAHKIVKNKQVKNIIGIGSSTGGPRALQEIIPQISEDVDGSFVVVQHMPPGFTKSLADRLNRMSHVIVKEAENDEIVRNGYCYIAPGDKHLKLVNHNNNIKIILDDGINVNGHKPSVDVLMNSISNLENINKIGVILTGMGSDGALGLKNLVKSGGYSIGQNEESCIVYGMPKSAYNIGAVDVQLPLEDIISEIYNKLGGL
ncbi:chemotaxis response regulator protein-glutamate methylesterase [Clostridium sp. D2Q-11]|uniref:Protein-glutamate methylesterase/protein-glutamine glutaminase n=1 Tax=Anaeromonas frigoriresistens TaxID=2683708 RepID=A0A942V4S9_9FIRM|nr:chemotaxis response regulator protein-glutamate methylesterase [Anaeromonas frigoriresistens]MBS4539867.1 chemotaxis response regulator protein-glutamate methylesterase [Anaeromonas frigoriresistens]